MKLSDLFKVELLNGDRQETVTAGVVVDVLQTLAVITSQMKAAAGNPDANQSIAFLNKNALQYIYDISHSDADCIPLTESVQEVLSQIKTAEELLDGGQIKPDLVKQFKAVVRDVLFSAIGGADGPYVLHSEYYEAKFERIGWKIDPNKGFELSRLPEIGNN